MSYQMGNYTKKLYMKIVIPFFLGLIIAPSHRRSWHISTSQKRKRTSGLRHLDLDRATHHLGRWNCFLSSTCLTKDQRDPTNTGCTVPLESIGICSVQRVNIQTLSTFTRHSPSATWLHNVVNPIIDHSINQPFGGSFYSISNRINRYK